MAKLSKIALSAGHYRYTAGKRIPKKLDKNETREWALNDRICDKIEQKLKAYEGYELLRTDDTTGEKAISVEDRAAESWPTPILRSTRRPRSGRRNYTTPL